MIEEEEVSEEEARQFAESIGAIFRLTSAKNKNGIDQLFYEIACKIAEIKSIPEKSNIVLGSNEVKKKKKKCC